MEEKSEQKQDVIDSPYPFKKTINDRDLKTKIEINIEQKESGLFTRIETAGLISFAVSPTIYKYIEKNPIEMHKFSLFFEKNLNTLVALYRLNPTEIPSPKLLESEKNSKSDNQLCSLFTQNPIAYEEFFLAYSLFTNEKIMEFYSGGKIKDLKTVLDTYFFKRWSKRPADLSKKLTCLVYRNIKENPTFLGLFPIGNGYGKDGKLKISFAVIRDTSESLLKQGMKKADIACVTPAMIYMMAVILENRLNDDNQQPPVEFTVCLTGPTLNGEYSGNRLWAIHWLQAIALTLGSDKKNLALPEVKSTEDFKSKVHPHMINALKQIYAGTDMTVNSSSIPYDRESEFFKAIDNKNINSIAVYERPPLRPVKEKRETSVGLAIKLKFTTFCQTAKNFWKVCGIPMETWKCSLRKKPYQPEKLKIKPSHSHAKKEMLAQDQSVESGSLVMLNNIIDTLENTGTNLSF